MRRFLALSFAMILFLSSIFPTGDKETFALVLSGGGERALAEIAVLQELDRRSIVPDLIVGSGTGALVGGLYAAGYTGDEIEALLADNSLSSMLFSPARQSGKGRLGTEFLDYEADIVTFPIGGKAEEDSSLADDHRLNAFLERTLASVSGVSSFNELSIPFLATGTDISEGRILVFTSGSLPFAIRASMGAPLYLDPVTLEDGSIVMDGGLGANIPVNVALEKSPDIILAVDVNDSLRMIGGGEEPRFTLQESVQAWNDYIISSGAENAYEKADWVIITDTAGYPSYSYSTNAKEILQKGREAAQTASEVFDELELRLGAGDRTLYRDLPAVSCVSLVVTDKLPNGTGERLRPFLGKELTDALLEELEGELSEIAKSEGLKSVSYSVRKGTLVIDAEEYPYKPGEIGLGFNGRIGLYYNGDAPYLGYYPEFSAEGYLSLLPELDLDFGAKVGEGLWAYAGLSHPFLSYLELFGFLEVRYGALFWKSIMGYEDYDFSNSLGSRLAAGVDLAYGSMMRMEALLGYDFSWVGKESSDGLGTLYSHYLFLGFGFTLDAYDNSDATATGADADLRISFGVDFPDTFMGYEIEGKAKAAFGPSDYFKFIAESELASFRRPLEYSSAWAITKSGLLTPDYLYAMGGVLIPLPASLYLSAGIYFEAYASDAEDYYPKHDWKLKDMLPFSTLDEDGLGIGGRIAFGFQAPFGRLGAELYLSDTARISFLVGLE